MKNIFFLVSIVLFYQCSTNHSNAVSEKIEPFVHEKTDRCIREGGEEFLFFYDDFSSEGAGGSVFFENDTIINKILFSYATSMVYTEQIYWFEQNKLIKFKQKTNYILPDKSGYSEEDSVVVEGEKIYKENSFNDTMYQKLLHTAADKNRCWSIQYVR